MAREKLSLLDFAPTEMALRHHLAHGWPNPYRAQAPEGEVPLAVEMGIHAARLDDAASHITCPEDAVTLVEHGASPGSIQELEESFSDDLTVLRAIHLKLQRPRAGAGDFVEAVSECGTWDDFGLVCGGTPMSLTALAYASRRGMSVKEALAPRVEGDDPFTLPAEVCPDRVPPEDLREGLEFVWRSGRISEVSLEDNASNPEAVAAIDGLVELVLAEGTGGDARSFLEQLLRNHYAGHAPLQESTPALPIDALTATTGLLSQPESLGLWARRYPLTAGDVRALIPHASLFGAELQDVYVRATPEVFRLLLTTPELSNMYFRYHATEAFDPDLVDVMATPIPEGHAADYLHQVGEQVYRLAGHNGKPPAKEMRRYLRDLWEAGYLPTGLENIRTWDSATIVEAEWEDWLDAADVSHLMAAQWDANIPGPLWVSLADKVTAPDVPRDDAWRRFILDDLLPALPRSHGGARNEGYVAKRVVELAAEVGLEDATDLTWASQWLGVRWGTVREEVLANVLLPAIARSSADGVDDLFDQWGFSHLLGPAAVGGLLTGTALRKATQNSDSGRAIAKAVEERFGTDMDAWRLADTLLKDWEGNLPELLDTVEALSK